jgi:hypothetical protein
VSRQQERSAQKPPNTARVIFGLNGMAMARSELTPVIRAAPVNFNEGGAALAGQLELDGAAGCVEIDVSGPDTVWSQTRLRQATRLVGG